MKVVGLPCAYCDGSGLVPSPAALRRARKDANLYLGDVARLARCSVSYLSDIERGQRRCSIRIRHIYEGLSPAPRARPRRGK